MERLTEKLSDNTKPQTFGGHVRQLITPNGIYKSTILKEYNKLYDRLVEYEDLGVTPEQVRQMDAEFSRVSEELGRYQGVEAWFKERYKANISIYKFSDIFIKYFEEQEEEKVNNWKVLTNEDADKWDEYQEAERQGTLLHLPCKAGDTVYLEAEYENEITEGRVTEISVLPDGVCIYIEREIGSGCSEGYGVNDFGYDVFLKREDAEKLLKEA